MKIISEDNKLLFVKKQYNRLFDKLTVEAPYKLFQSRLFWFDENGNQIFQRNGDYLYIEDNQFRKQLDLISKAVGFTELESYYYLLDFLNEKYESIFPEPLKGLGNF